MEGISVADICHTQSLNHSLVLEYKSPFLYCQCVVLYMRDLTLLICIETWHPSQFQADVRLRRV